jgi:hypothetical protein
MEKNRWRLAWRMGANAQEIEGGDAGKAVK